MSSYALPAFADLLFFLEIPTSMVPKTSIRANSKNILELLFDPMPEPLSELLPELPHVLFDPLLIVLSEPR